ncbi:MAG: hypothetical protein K6T75_08520 [Acetobacteraceae bacterium]|nr:hypothetical protein [Acetobacteraceae bacterium]
MSLTSTDLQNLIPKSGEVGRVQEVLDRRTQADLQQAAARFSEQVELRTRHVPDAPRAREGRVERHRKGGQGSGQGGGQGRRAAGRQPGEGRGPGGGPGAGGRSGGAGASAAAEVGPEGRVPGAGPAPSPNGLGRHLDVRA